MVWYYTKEADLMGSGFSAAIQPLSTSVAEPEPPESLWLDKEPNFPNYYFSQLVINLKHYGNFYMYVYS